MVSIYDWDEGEIRAQHLYMTLSEEDKYRICNLIEILASRNLSEVAKIRQPRRFSGGKVIPFPATG